MICTCCKLGRQRHSPWMTSEQAQPRAATQHQRHEQTPQDIHALLGKTLQAPLRRKGAMANTRSYHGQAQATYQSVDTA